MARGGHGLLEVLPGPTMPYALLRPAGGPTLKQPYDHFRGGLPTGRATCSRLLPLWTPHVLRLCSGELQVDGFFQRAMANGAPKLLT
jgi:hypothetical protein